MQETRGQVPSNLLPALRGKSTCLQIGDDAIAVGNRVGLTASLTMGVISGLNREVEPPGGSSHIGDLIQFDSATNPDNSGSAR